MYRVVQKKGRNSGLPLTNKRFLTRNAAEQYARGKWEKGFYIIWKA